MTGRRIAPHLSRLDERFGLADQFTFVDAISATVTLAGADGRCREYVDFMSAYGSVNFGHRNPAVDHCLQQGSDVAGMCYPAEAERVAGWLCERLGRGADGRVLFQVGGSFAVTTAIALAQHARPGAVAAIRGGFHGLGADTLAITSVQRAFALQETSLSRSLAGCVRIIEPGSLPDSWEGVSCLIYEPVQGANGYVPLDTGWLAALERSARDAGVVIVADEIQAGFFRHGVLSPTYAAGLRPDIQLYSKSLTNGLFPLSAVVYDAALEPPRQQAFLAHTFQTSSLGYRAASAVADFVDTAPIAAMAAAVSDRLGAVAEELGAADSAADIHVTGPSLSFRPTRASARDVAREAVARGLFVFVGGGDFERIRVAPPVTIHTDELARGTDILVDLLCPAGGSHHGTGPRYQLAPQWRVPVLREEFFDSLRTFVRRTAAAQGVADADVDIPEDANLLDLGLVNSFTMVALLVHVEELLGVSVDVTAHEPETFFTLQGMYDSLVTAGRPQ